MWDTVLTAYRDSEKAGEIVARPGVVFDTVLDGPGACRGVLKEEL